MLFRIKLNMVQLLSLFVLLYTPGLGTPQDLPQSDELNLQALVTFDFRNRDVDDVLQHLARLTGWSMFYDPAQVHGKVTIVTPDKIPLAQAIRLLQRVVGSRQHAVQVLLPAALYPVPLATVLSEYNQSAKRRDVVVWRNSNALGPQSRPYACGPASYSAPLLPYWVDVIVDEKRQRHPRGHP